MKDREQVTRAGTLGPARRALVRLREHERLLMITISTVLVMAGQGVVAPVLPLYARSFGVGAATVGLTLSFFALARLILNVPLGLLADRLGRRVLLVSGPLVTAAGMVGSGLAPGIVQLLLWRFVAGAGSAMYMTAAQIYLVDISTPANRARFLGTNQGALLVGVSIGPAVGGVVAELFGLRAPFYVVGAASLVACAYAYLRLPETRHLAGPREDRPKKEPGRSSWATMLLSLNFFCVALVTMSIFFTRTAARQTLMPILADSRFDLSTSAIGLVFTGMALVNIAGLAPAAYVADHFGRKWAIVPSGLVMAASLILMALADSRQLFFLSALVMAMGTSIAGPAPAAYAADIAPAENRGLAMGLYRAAGDAGFLVGPPLLGAVADATSVPWGLAANAVLVAISAAVFWIFAGETLERRRRSVAVEGPPGADTRAAMEEA